MQFLSDQGQYKQTNKLTLLHQFDRHNDLGPKTNGWTTSK